MRFVPFVRLEFSFLTSGGTAGGCAWCIRGGAVRVTLAGGWLTGSAALDQNERARSV
jgi:hypothetical protein